ncbi:MAG: ATPase [Flavobacteriia bacterium]|nr:ATPase [Flavobacteriia bacterium]
MIPFKIQDNFRCFDFKECLSFIYNQGQMKYGKHFQIRKEDQLIIYKLLIYAIRDEENCIKHNIDLNKGILLLGPIGCGKTSLMTLIKPFFYPEYQYRIKAAREIAFEFINDGFGVLNKYGKAQVSYCFDDLGVEKSLKHFGNDCNTMAEILLSNYDYYFQTRKPIHATTNLNAEELEKLYGNRVRSRLREMFNLIAFDTNVPDKRS